MSEVTFTEWHVVDEEGHWSGGLQPTRDWNEVVSRLAFLAARLERLGEQAEAEQAEVTARTNEKRFYFARDKEKTYRVLERQVTEWSEVEAPDVPVEVVQSHHEWMAECDARVSRRGSA